MKLLMFKNESGDDSYPIGIIDKNYTEKQIKDFVIKNIGCDYIQNEDYICGQYWIEDYSKLKLLSNL